MFTKRSHILKQTCSFQLQVYLNMCDLSVDIRHERVKPNDYKVLQLRLEIRNQRVKMGEEFE